MEDNQGGILYSVLMEGIQEGIPTKVDIQVGIPVEEILKEDIKEDILKEGKEERIPEEEILEVDIGEDILVEGKGRILNSDILEEAFPFPYSFLDHCIPMTHLFILFEFLCNIEGTILIIFQFALLSLMEWNNHK